MLTIDRSATAEPVPRCKCGRLHPNTEGPNKGKCGVCIAMPGKRDQSKLKGVMRCSTR